VIREFTRSAVDNLRSRNCVECFGVFWYMYNILVIHLFEDQPSFSVVNVLALKTLDK
jgi:hypothetical protein